MKNFILACLLFASTTLLFSCAKDGEIGPMGPAGPQGIPGANGAQGPAGTANVIYSDWIALPDTAVFSSANRKNFTIPAKAITQAHLDNALIYGYLKGGPTSLVPLPYANKYVYSSGDVNGSYLITMLVGPGSVSLNLDWLTPGPIPAAFANSNKFPSIFSHFRYVIVPGSVRAAMEKTIDVNDPNAVAKYLGVKL